MPLKMYEEKKKFAKQIIGIAAGKGGVGKSTVTVNLAHALTSLGYTVGILDADIYGPSIRRMLPEDRLPGKDNERFTPALSQGISTMSMGFFRKEEESASVRAPIANRVISQFINQVQWGELDYLLIDFPPGTGDIQLTLAQEGLISGAIMVTTPQQISVMDVKKAMQLFNQVNIPIIGVIENMSYLSTKEGELAIFGSGGGASLASESGIPFLGKIPLDPELCAFSDSGESIIKKHLSGETAQSFLKVTKKMIDEISQLESSQPEIALAWKDLGEK